MGLLKAKVNQMREQEKRGEGKERHHNQAIGLDAQPLALVRSEAIIKLISCHSAIPENATVPLWKNLVGAARTQVGATEPAGTKYDSALAPLSAFASPSWPT